MTAVRRTKLVLRRPQTVSEKSLARMAAHPRIRTLFSAALRKPIFPRDIYISGPKGKYVHFVISPPSKFDKYSFRTKSVGRRGTRLIVGCPQGQYDRANNRCKVGMRLQAVLVPKDRVLEMARLAKKTRRFAKNPLLMTVTNPGGRPGKYSGNPVDIEYDSGSRLFKVHRTNPTAGYHSNPRDLSEEWISVAKVVNPSSEEELERFVSLVNQSGIDVKRRGLRYHGEYYVDVLVPSKNVKKARKVISALSKKVSLSVVLGKFSENPSRRPLYQDNFTVPLWSNPHEEDEPTLTCTGCGGELTYLGPMGNLVYFRCRACGLEQSKPASECPPMSFDENRKRRFKKNPWDIPVVHAVMDDNPPLSHAVWNEGPMCDNPDHPFCDNPSHGYTHGEPVSTFSGYENPATDFAGMDNQAQMLAYPNASYAHGEPVSTFSGADNPKPVFGIGDKVRNRHRVMMGDQIELERNQLGEVVGYKPFMGDLLYEVQFLTPTGLRTMKFFAKDLTRETSQFRNNPPGYSGPDAPRRLRAYEPKGRGGYYGSRGEVSALRKEPVTRSKRPIRAMKTRKVKIPVAQFEKWLRSRGSKEEWARYQKEKTAYRRFHKGADPTFITRKLVDAGTGPRVVARAFGYSMGKSPFEPYITPSGSGKGSKTPYLHEYETMPEGITNSSGKVVIKPLEGRTKITDWIHY